MIKLLKKVEEIQVPSGNRVVVIGGGIIGTTLACFLTREGQKVTLIERDTIGLGTTSKNTGVLALVSRPADARAVMAFYGRMIYEALKVEMDDAFYIDRKGTLVVLAKGSHAGLEFLEENCRGIQSFGAEAEILDGAEVKRRVAGLGVEVEAGLLDPSGALVDAVLISKAMLSDAVSRGAEVREHEPVQSIVTHGDRVTGVQTENGNIEADAVIVAAGIWSPFLTEALGLKVPVVPRRGQLLHTEKVEMVSPHLIQSATYVLDKTAGERSDEEAMPRFRFSYTLQQHSDGHCVLGSTREFAGYDERLTSEGRKAIQDGTKEWFPDVSKLRIAREVGGLRPWMPDHYPIIGPSSKLQGLWYATGHEGDGINHAPVTAKLICAQMTGQDLGIPGLDPSILLPDRLGL